MNQLLILFLAILSSCFSVDEQLIVQGPSPKKQKQKIAFLQKKLEIAAKERKKIETDVERLSSAIDEAQLALIRRQLDDHERSGTKDTALFMDEREALYRMIEAGPSPSAFEAQVELDRILRLITESSDDEKYVF
jgi:hypothetical protein